MQTLPLTAPLSDATIVIGAIDSDGAVINGIVASRDVTIFRICTRHPDACDVAHKHPINGLLWVPGDADPASPFDKALCRALGDRHAGTVVDLRDATPATHAVLVVVNATGVRRVCCYSDDDPTVEHLEMNSCDEQVWTPTGVALSALRAFIARAFARLSPGATIEVIDAETVDLTPPA
jgi:hypothetical protein